jgi:chromodomain-helicase-DNA-binding protein 4
MVIDKVNKKGKKKKGSSDDDTNFQADDSVDDESDANARAEAQVDAEDLVDADARQRSASTLVNKPLHKQKAVSASGVPTNLTSKLKHSATTLDVMGRSNSGGAPMTAPGKTGKSSATRQGATNPSHVVDVTSGPPTARPTVAPYQRARLPTRSPLETSFGQYKHPTCPACHRQHPRGACELKAAGIEHCGLCGLAHFGHARTCPHIKSETQVREMLKALKSSPEKKELVDLAMKYLRGVKGNLVQLKKRELEKSTMQAAGIPVPRVGRPPLSPGHAADGSSAQPVASSNGTRTGCGQPPQGFGESLPLRDVPPTYHAPVDPAPGSVGSHLLGQGQHGGAAQQQRARPGPAVEDSDVENALRGYLGR